MWSEWTKCPECQQPPKHPHKNRYRECLGEIQPAVGEKRAYTSEECEIESGQKADEDLSCELNLCRKCQYLLKT